METDALAPWSRRAVCAVALLASASASPMAQSAEVPLDDLKRSYLACESAAAEGRQNGDDVMHCSVLYEELKRRAFDGDFRKLRMWHQTMAPDLAPTASQRFLGS